MTLSEIEKYIVSNNKWGVTMSGSVGYSNGISLAIDNNEGFYSEVQDAISKFYAGDYGTFYEYGETPILDHEYGWYDTSIGTVCIHNECYYIVVYFQFER
jgi:hypothetical protein